MGVGSLFRVIGIIIGLSATAIGAGLDIANVAGRASDWRLVSLVGFALFAIMVGWLIYEQRKEIGKLKDSRPIIKADVQKDFQCVGINVRNDGAAGEFKAQIEVREHTQDYLSQDWTLYYGYWDSVSDSMIPIMKGMSHFLKLASFEDTTANVGYLRFYRSPEQGHISRDTHSYPIFKPDGFLIPESTLRITISSRPDAVKGPVVLTLRIRATCEVEEIVPESQPNWLRRLLSHKASSQS